MVKIVGKGNGSGGCRTGRSWDDLVKALVESKSIHLWDGEYISEVEIDMAYGIYLKIDRKKH